MKFKFHKKLANTSSNIILHINPIFELLPLPITRYDDPFLPFGKAIISATQDSVAGYFFDFASYLAMGGAGAVALERSIAYVPDNCVTILHGAFTGTAYAPMASPTAFNLDAITVATETDLSFYTENSPYMAFLMSHTEKEIPEQGGIYRTDTATLHTGDKQLSLTTNDILYAGKLDDFAEKIREGVLALQ